MNRLEAGVLTLRTSGGVPVGTAFTDRNGGWTFQLDGPGEFFLEASADRLRDLDGRAPGGDSRRTT